MKRCPIAGLTRDKEYNLTQGTPYSKILYFTANPDGEAETVKIKLKPKPRLKILDLSLNFADLAIKGKNSIGNILTKNAIYKLSLKEKGESTLGGANIWWDPDVKRLNTDDRGNLLGEFRNGDKILVVLQSGEYRLTNYDLSNHYEDDLLIIEKFQPEKVFSAVYFDATQKYYYIKRFTFESTDKLTSFIDDENAKSKLIFITAETFPQVKIAFGGKHKKRAEQLVDVEQFIAVKSIRAKGKRITTFQVAKITEIEPLQKAVPENVPEPEEEKKAVDDVDESKIFDTPKDSKIIQKSLF